MKYLTTHRSTWQRHLAHDCFADCFYCRRDRASLPVIVQPRLIVTPGEAKAGR